MYTVYMKILQYSVAHYFTNTNRENRGITALE
jgi:hypothetical protein